LRASISASLARAPCWRARSIRPSPHARKDQPARKAGQQNSASNRLPPAHGHTFACGFPGAVNTQKACNAQPRGCALRAL
jgi:hypothetical protein